jgi:hypothetical protein
MSKQYFCCDEKRQNEVNKHKTLNGIAYLEVLEDQLTLQVHFIKSKNLNTIKQNNILIEGGERIKNIGIQDPEILSSKVLQVKVDKAGDFSTYTFRLVKESSGLEPLKGFDPILSSIAFSFKAACTGDFDCSSKTVCPPWPAKQPDINYLAKDYASFRQLMLDRMSRLIPDWKERHAADFGIALIELLAYAGDHLSYQQDAVATEAYLGTARRRISVRRHARLVDYFMHDGCNSRVWVQIKVNADNVKVLKGTSLLTKIEGYSQGISQTVYDEHKKEIEEEAEFFEIMHDAELFKDHKNISFYTWGDENCCLPKGATTATLSGHLKNLKSGEVLIFAETLGPKNGIPEDADHFKRHAVRLTKVEYQNGLGQSLKDPLYDKEITKIEWHQKDALPFPLCLSSEITGKNGKEIVKDISLAHGNLVLADHGRTIKDEEIGAVPNLSLSQVSINEEPHCTERKTKVLPLRFFPKLKKQPVTQSAQIQKTKIVNKKKQTEGLLFDPEGPATEAFEGKMKDVIPAIFLKDSNGFTWSPKRDLLLSDEFAKEFVLETEADGVSSIRFGDEYNGKRPEEETLFWATYRLGNGTKGNLGANTIAHIITDYTSIEGVWNPLPAKGGKEPESLEEVRQNAPWAFRVQERAVTPEDYAAMAEKHKEVQKAVAVFRWTGSWVTVFIAIDRYEGLEVDKDFKKEIRDYLEKYRMAGHDLEIEGPQYVPLEIEMQVCIKPEYFRADVKTAILQLFSNQKLTDGRLGVFHPDNFIFGQAVYLSRLYEAAQSSEGVQSVQIIKFQRQGLISQEAIDSGKLIIGRFEIARLDNDPNYPEHGVFEIDIKGGK